MFIKGDLRRQKAQKEVGVDHISKMHFQFIKIKSINGLLSQVGPDEIPLDIRVAAHEPINF